MPPRSSIGFDAGDEQAQAAPVGHRTVADACGDLVIEDAVVDAGGIVVELSGSIGPIALRLADSGVCVVVLFDLLFVEHVAGA